MSLRPIRMGVKGSGARRCSSVAFHSFSPLTERQKELMRIIDEASRMLISPFDRVLASLTIAELSINIDFVDELGDTPLTKALSKMDGGRFDWQLLLLVEELIKAGADIHKRGAFGWSAADLAEALIEEGHPLSDDLKKLFYPRC